MIRKNFHMHTTYCDGAGTPREMVEAALEKGFTAIGFSGHSHTPFDEEYCMMPDSTEAYRREILALQEEYKDRIRIYLGLEFDLFSDEDPDRWDYLVGSVHYVHADGVYIPVDESEEITRTAIAEHFGGDPYAFCEAYFEEVGSIFAACRCDIVGHIDLITKFNEFVETAEDGSFVSQGTGKLFDEEDPRYVAAYTKAIQRILRDAEEAGKEPLFEINTGAISRGYRTEPYPGRGILRAIRDLGGKAILSSDAHSPKAIDCGFEQAEALAGECGIALADLY